MDRSSLHPLLLALGRSFAGLGYDFADQDACVTEGEGPIEDRTQEHLGYPDQGVIAERQLLLRCIADVQAGREPPNVVRDSSYDPVRELVARSEVVPASTNWRTYWRDGTRGRQLAAAE